MQLKSQSPVSRMGNLPKTEIMVTTNKTSSCCEGYFVCNLFSFCRNENVSHEPNRKNIFRKLLENRKFKMNDSEDQSEKEIRNSLEALIDLYKNHNEESIERLKKCRLNPDFDPTVKIRSDLEFFVPQLCNFMIFHEKYQNDELNFFIEDACKISFFFSHMVYWSLNSLTKLITESKIIEYPIIKESLQYIVEISCQHKKNQAFIAFSEILKKFRKNNQNQEEELKIRELISDYGTCNERNDEKNKNQMKIKANDIRLTIYTSIYEKEEMKEVNGYLSTINFFEDLNKISEHSINVKKMEKLQFIKGELKKMNEKLPAAVYIPFLKESIRNYAVLNISVEETETFSTKSRTPFSISLEIFRPEEEYLMDTSLIEYTKKESHINNLEQKEDFKKLNKNYNYNYLNFDLTLSNPLTIKSHRKVSQTFHEECKQNFGQINDKSPLSVLFKNKKRNSLDIDINEKKYAKKYSVANPTLTQSEFHLQSEDLHENNISISKSTNTEYQIKEKNIENNNEVQKHELGLNHYDNNIFVSHLSGNSSINSDGEKNDDTKNPKRKENSMIQDESIIEKKDNSILFGTRQNNFSIENENTNNRSISLGKKFEKNRAFFGEDSAEQSERIKLSSPFKDIRSWKITHLIVKTGDNLLQEQFALQLIYQFYQIFEIEKTNLKVTPYEVLSLGPDFGIIEEIKNAITLDHLKKQCYDLNYSTSLYSFFSRYFQPEIKKARNNFCSSLAAYSLICYFLQVKDRHNRNILLHKEGYLIHIDFGFFLSNSPGKGLEFEKPVPFKLISEYLEILSGFKSSLFLKFRKLFFKGFKAARKHQHKILLLVKMMFSSHGTNLPCFKGGEACITELEKRFNPPDIGDDGDLNIFIQNLINESLDNLRTRWYDKFQYYCQGTFY